MLKPIFTLLIISITVSFYAQKKVSWEELKLTEFKNDTTLIGTIRQWPVLRNSQQEFFEKEVLLEGF